MALMTVYHGGYQVVEKPEIRANKNTKDFIRINFFAMKLSIFLIFVQQFQNFYRLKHAQTSSH
mgnify:CR=1 FL=1